LRRQTRSSMPTVATSSLLVPGRKPDAVLPRPRYVMIVVSHVSSDFQSRRDLTARSAVDGTGCSQIKWITQSAHLARHLISRLRRLQPPLQRCCHHHSELRLCDTLSRCNENSLHAPSVPCGLSTHEARLTMACQLCRFYLLSTLLLLFLATLSRVLKTHRPS
jgi:hypothetical protein